MRLALQKSDMNILVVMREEILRFEMKWYARESTDKSARIHRHCEWPGNGNYNRWGRGCMMKVFIALLEQPVWGWAGMGSVVQVRMIVIGRVQG